jgi:hypothetical protein
MKPWLVRVAVLALAVALGVGIGAGPLQHSSSERDRELAAQKAAKVRLEREVAAFKSSAAFADGFVTATAPSLLRGALTGRTVTLVTLPGADPAVVAGLRADVAAAQGRILSQVDLAPAMSRASSRQLVEALTSQMLAQAPGVSVPAGASGYDRFGVLLARALGTGPTGQPAQAAFDPIAVGIMSGLKSAGLATPSQPPAGRAGLALVVAGPEASTSAEAAQNAVPVAILAAFGRTLPTVVVGPTGAAGDRGVLGALRGSAAAKVVSTVDSAESAMGRAAGVLALAARARGTVGHYGGGDGADGAVPGATP